MKWFLNVLISISAAFLRWNLAGANWTVMFSSVSRNSMRSVDTSLSRMWNIGRSPAALSFRMIVVAALIVHKYFGYWGRHWGGVEIVGSVEESVS